MGFIEGLDRNFVQNGSGKHCNPPRKQGMALPFDEFPCLRGGLLWRNYDQGHTQQRLDFFGLIWDSIDDKSITPPDWHVRELERRIAAADADRSAAEPWEDV